LVDFAIKGTDNTSKHKEVLLLKADLLDARADSIQNFIAGNIMRTSAVILRQEAG